MSGLRLKIASTEGMPASGGLVYAKVRFGSQRAVRTKGVVGGGKVGWPEWIYPEGAVNLEEGVKVKVQIMQQGEGRAECLGVSMLVFSNLNAAEGSKKLQLVEKKKGRNTPPEGSITLTWQLIDETRTSPLLKTADNLFLLSSFSIGLFCAMMSLWAIAEPVIFYTGSMSTAAVAYLAIYETGGKAQLRRQSPPTTPASPARLSRKPSDLSSSTSSSDR